MLARISRDSEHVTRAPQDGPNSRSTSLDLPQELIYHVIDQLEDDFVALKALSLVSRVWHPHTRHHLFKEVVIGDSARSPESRLQELCEILRERPALGQHVQTFELVNEQEGKGWIGEDPVTSNYIAEVLPQLTSLKILCITGSLEALHWPLMSPVLRQALLLAMSQHTISEMSLEGVEEADILLEHLSKLSHLRDLLLHSITVSSPARNLSLYPASVPTLKEDDERLANLDISTCGHALAFLFRYAASSEGSRNCLFPRAVTVDTTKWTDADMETGLNILLQVSAPTVESYTICHLSIQRLDWPSLKSFFNLLPFTNLKRLELRMVKHEFFDPIPLLIDALNALSKRREPSTMRCITLRFECRQILRQSDDPDTDMREGILAFSRASSWAELDSVLAFPAFADLKEMEFIFGTGHRTLSDAQWETVEERIRFQLKESCGKGKSCSVTRR